MARMRSQSKQHQLLDVVVVVVCEICSSLFCAWRLQRTETLNPVISRSRTPEFSAEPRTVYLVPREVSLARETVCSRSSERALIVRILVTGSSNKLEFEVSNTFSRGPSGTPQLR